MVGSGIKETMTDQIMKIRRLAKSRQIKLTTALTENDKPTPKRKTGRPSTESTFDVSFSSKKPRKAPDLAEVPDDIQFSNFEH